MVCDVERRLENKAKQKKKKQKTLKSKIIFLQNCVTCNAKREKEKKGAEWKQNVSENSVANKLGTTNETKKINKNKNKIVTGKQCEATIEIRKENETNIRNQ